MHLDEQKQNIIALKSQNNKLKDEIVQWKSAARREGIYGILIGASVAFILGTWVGAQF